jgi:hypothetical protein
MRRNTNMDQRLWQGWGKGMSRRSFLRGSSPTLGAAAIASPLVSFAVMPQPAAGSPTTDR